MCNALTNFFVTYTEYITFRTLYCLDIQLHRDLGVKQKHWLFTKLTISVYI